MVSTKSNIVDLVEESEDNLDNFEDDFGGDKSEEKYHISEKKRHLRNWMDAWRSIHLLEGHEEECKNATDGKIVWKVVREVDEGEF